MKIKFRIEKDDLFRFVNGEEVSYYGVQYQLCGAVEVEADVSELFYKKEEHKISRTIRGSLNPVVNQIPCGKG